MYNVTAKDPPFSHKTFSACTGLFLLLAACSAESETASPSIPSDFAELDRFVEDFIAEEGLRGATVAVVHHEQGVLYENAYGDFSLDRLSLVASTSKLISAGVLGNLADRGMLDLNAPISSYLGDWKGNKPDITTAQLLSNSAGMVGLLDDVMYNAYLCQFTGTSLIECAEEIYTADDEDDRVPPDTQFRYGGAQWQLAGGIAEVVSGKKWVVLVQEVYEPCQLENLGYRNHFLQQFLENGEDGVLLYPSFVDGDVKNVQATDNPSIEGGAYLSIGDLAKLLLLHLRDGRCGENQVLAPQTVETLRADRIRTAYNGSSGDDSLPGYGMGWWLSRDGSDLAVAAGAYGSTPWIEPSRGYGVAVILEGTTEQGTRFQKMAKPIIDRLFGYEAGE